MPGQAFDITDLPNGSYYVRVHVNPTGSILESDADNNIEDRLIKLSGSPVTVRRRAPVARDRHRGPVLLLLNR